MTTKQMFEFLDFLSRNDLWVFSLQDFAMYFKEYSDEELQKNIDIFLEMTMIKHVYKNLYMDPRSRNIPIYAREDLIKYLRPMKFTYISQEEILSEYGIISQVCTMMTCMTTGESEKIVTPVGFFGFYHFDLPEDTDSFMQEIVFDKERGAYEATPYRAWLDLKKTSTPNIWRLVDREELAEATQGRIPDVDDIDDSLFKPSEWSNLPITFYRKF